jgi:hypothetical protein
MRRWASTRMKMAAFIEAFGIGIGSLLFRIRIANPDTDSDTDCYGLSLFSKPVDDLNFLTVLVK